MAISREAPRNIESIELSQTTKLQTNEQSDLDLNQLETIRFEIISAEQTIPLRHSVLWPNGPISRVFLPEDNSGLHLGAFLFPHQDPIAVISLFVEPYPIDNEIPGPSAHQGMVHFRKFACDPLFQRKGIGSGLLAYATSMAKTKFGATCLWCDARTTSLGWYRNRGLSPFGDVFDKSGIEYIRMKIDLAQSALVST